MKKDLPMTSEAYFKGIPRGRKKAVHASYLARKWKTDARGVRTIVSMLRAEGYAVCSGPAGYWRATSRIDVYETQNLLFAQAATMTAVASKMGLMKGL